MSRQVLTYPDIPAVQTQAQADLRYLPLTGGTITGNLGVGVTPEAWGAPVVRVGAAGAFYSLPVGSTPTTGFAHNTYYDGASSRAITNNPAVQLHIANDGALRVYNAPAVAAGAVQAFTPRLTVGATGTVNFSPDAGGIAASFNEQVRFNSGKALLWQDPTNNYYLGWRMSNASPAQLTLCYWGGDTLIHFGTEGLHTPYLLAVPGNHMYLRGLNSGHNLYVDQWGSVLFTHMGGGLVGPASDNAYMLGQGGFRWTTVFAVTGAINTCSREVKEIVGTVDDTVALQQLMGLPAIYRFHYKHRVPVADADSEAPEEERFTLETDTSKEFIGPVAEEMPMDMKVGEFEGGNVNTEGHLMASLRGAVKEYRDRITDLANRMTILEGRMPA